jgi:hygromycin-B 7''-O-kinase
MERPVFRSRAEYAGRFTDAAYWRPYVEAVCARHGLGPGGEIRAGLPGTNAVFLVDGRYAVKLYTDLFGGATSYPAERDLYGWFAGHPGLPVPALVAQGDLFPPGEGWPWPYIVTTVVPGASYGETAAGVAYADKLALAAFLGGVCRTLHGIRWPGTPALPARWEPFFAFLAARRGACVADHRAWGTLPARLIAGIDAYLPPLADLVDTNGPPCLLHADLNADHVLGGFRDGHWRPTGIIDFGDARVGDLTYELPALHLGLFHADKQLLRAWLAAYGQVAAWDDRWIRRAMSMSLLHQFDVLVDVFRNLPAAHEVGNLRELATLLWDLDAPGMAGAGPRPV